MSIEQTLERIAVALEALADGASLPVAQPETKTEPAAPVKTRKPRKPKTEAPSKQEPLITDDIELPEINSAEELKTYTIEQSKQLSPEGMAKLGGLLRGEYNTPNVSELAEELWPRFLKDLILVAREYPRA